MSKPTVAELNTAMAAAAAMKEHDNDLAFIAKTLLNHNYRLKFYEDLLKYADLYINHGQSEHDHMELIRCIDKIKEIESFTAHEQSDNFGLE